MKRHGSADVFVTDKLRSYCVVPCWLVALQSPAGQWMKDAMTAQMVTDALMMAIWGRGGQRNCCITRIRAANTPAKRASG